jgi:hypothetical protein
MILTRLNPKGIHPREAAGIRDIEAAISTKAFCVQWFGYTNLLVRKRNAQAERREIDLVLVTHDRVVMADLKDWSGQVSNSGGMWLHRGQRRGQSASLKIEENAQALKGLIRSEVGAVRPTPWIEHFVVFTVARRKAALVCMWVGKQRQEVAQQQRVREVVRGKPGNFCVGGTFGRKDGSSTNITPCSLFDATTIPDDQSVKNRMIGPAVE